MIKGKNGATAMPIKKRDTTTKSHKPIPKAKKAEASSDVRTETTIAKMTFSSDHFEAEQDVLDWLEKAEFDGEADIVETEDGYEARPAGTSDADWLRIGKVEVDDEGVEAFIGERAITDDDDDDDDAKAEAETEAKSDADEDTEAKADDADEEAKMGGKGKKKPGYKKSAAPVADPEPKKLSKRQEFLAKKRAEAEASRSGVKKFDTWDAMFSNGNTLAKALSDGMAWDGIPPGVAEVQVAFFAAIGNILSGEGMPEGNKQEALNKAASDFAEIIGGLDTFFDAYVESDEEAVAKAFTSDDLRAKLAKWADTYGEFVTSTSEAPKTVAKAANDADAPAAIDYNKIGETIAGLVAKAIDPLVEQIDEVRGTVEKVASRAPTKKAADPEDGGAAGPRRLAQADHSEAHDRFAKSVFG